MVAECEDVPVPDVQKTSSEAQRKMDKPKQQLQPIQQQQQQQQQLLPQPQQILIPIVQPSTPQFGFLQQVSSRTQSLSLNYMY